MRFVLLLTCLAVLAHCGPVPACQLDELLGDCFSASPEAAEAPAPAGPVMAAPAGDDTPDDIARDLLIHQSFGSIHTPAPALHDVGGQNGVPQAVPLPPRGTDSLVLDHSEALPRRALYPPSPPTLKHRPLLI